MQNKNTIIITLGIIVALGVGYAVGASNNRSESNDGTHMMRNEYGSNMQDMMTDMNANLVGKNGDDFDKAFIGEMVVHHQGAIQMAQLALTNAKHQEIKDLANAIITAQNKEINTMLGWSKVWYGR